MATQYATQVPYGSKIANKYYVQTPTGGQYSSIPASRGSVSSPAVQGTLGAQTTGMGQSQPAQSSNPPLEQASGFNPPDFDSLIAPAIQGYEGYISTLQSQLPDTLAGIDKDLATKTASLQSSIGAQEKTIGNAKTEQVSSQENAANEARRIFGEIQSGLQARYGGTTGTGAFATELAGRQTGANIANIRTTGAQLVKQLDDKLVQVQEIGRLSLEDIQNQAEQQKKEAQNNLQTQIAEIRSKIGETQARKADLYANAYQNYQQYVQEVNARNTQFQQQLYAQQKAAEQQLESAKQRASSVASTANVQDLKTLIEQLGPGVNVSSKVALPNGAEASVTSGQGQQGDYLDELLKQYVTQ